MHVPGLLPLTRSSTVVYWLLNMVILFFVYIDKKGDHVRIWNLLSKVSHTF